MFGKQSIRYYDRIYASQQKAFRQEVDYLLQVIHSQGGAASQRLLDVACGTGEHLKYLKQHFPAEGLDIVPEFVQAAQEKHPELSFHVGDMRHFRLERKYGIITCLFSSIGYMTALEELHTAVQTMKTHLEQGGILLIEPWFTPDTWKSGTISLVVINEEKLKIVRMSTSQTEGTVSRFDLHYLIGTPEKTEHEVEVHRLGLFTVEQMKEAFRQAQLKVTYDEQGPTGRGLYIGRNT